MYKRGQVYEVYFPKPRYNPEEVPNHKEFMPKPHTVLHGKHMAIVLADPNEKLLSKDQALVVPISTAKTAVKEGNLLPTHVPLQPSDHDFLSDTSYALAFQIIPLPSHWLQGDKLKGEIEPGAMKAVTLATFISTGSYELVLEIANQISEKKLAEMLDELDVEAIDELDDAASE